MTLQFVDTSTNGLLRPDFSTIDTVRLVARPVYKKPPTYQISTSMGSGCAGDPPGYPSYFLRSVYTSHGNSPRKGAQEVISFMGNHYVIFSEDDFKRSWGPEYEFKRERRLRMLWKPLPLEHPRTQAWIADRIRFFKGCLIDPRKFGHDRTHIPSLHGEWSAADLYEIAQALEIDLTDAAEPKRWHEIVAEVDERTDAATWAIREFYPEYVKTDPAPEYTGNWWEILAEQPTPENCPGETWGWGKSSKARHPVNGTWCQVCNWHADE